MGAYNGKKACGIVFYVVLFAIVLGCGGIRYSRVAPDIADFHPKTIGVLPVDVGTHGEARRMVDRIFADVLAETGWFSSVALPEEIQKEVVTDDVLRKAMVEYLTKLKTVNFSDPDLSNMIGKGYSIESFVVVVVDFWDYTMQGEDKVAKVGFSLTLVDAPTGKIIWEAGHHEVEDYWLIKPDRGKLGRTVARLLVAEMPH